MTKTAIRISPDDLARFIASLFEKKGMRVDDARSLADVIVWADRRGISSHGIARTAMYLRIIDTGEMDARAQPEILDSAPALVTVDAHRSAGPVAMKIALEETFRRARSQGSCTTLIRATTHTGAIGHYAWQAAQRGFVGIHINSGPPNMAYHGARVTSLATSPIAIGVPSEEGPLVLDMATAMIANGRLQQAMRDNKPIPAGSALTRAGEPTTDASKAEILLPLGGPKGSGLSFMFEAVTSVLAAHPILMTALGPEGERRHVHNAMFVAIDIAKLRPVEAFKRDMSTLGKLIKSLPRLDPEAEILLPGERGARSEVERDAKGIPVGSAIWSKLLETADHLGVPHPKVQS